MIRGGGINAKRGQAKKRKTNENAVIADADDVVIDETQLDLQGCDDVTIAETQLDLQGRDDDIELDESDSNVEMVNVTQFD